MIALLRLFELVQVGIEVLLVEEGGAVEPLELLAAGVVLPVGAGDAEQLERADLAGVRNVRAAAQVDELALAVEAQRRILLQLVVDVLDLVAPGPGPGTSAAALGGRPLEALERLGLLDDLPHLLLDAREVLLADRGRRIDVVIEAVLEWPGRRRAERRGRAADRPGHDVGAAMAQHVEGFRVLVGENLKRRLRRARRRPGEYSRSRSTTVPLTLAATAAWASRLPMDSATSRGRVPAATWRAEPSGSLRVSMGADSEGVDRTATPTTGRPAKRHGGRAVSSLGVMIVYGIEESI